MFAYSTARCFGSVRHKARQLYTWEAKEETRSPLGRSLPTHKTATTCRESLESMCRPSNFPPKQGTEEWKDVQRALYRYVHNRCGDIPLRSKGLEAHTYPMCALKLSTLS